MSRITGRKRKATKRPRPAPMYVIARHREWTFGGEREDGSAWEVRVPVLGSRPVRVAVRDVETVRKFVSHYIDEVREADVKGQPLTPFPTDEELKRRGEEAVRAEQARRQKALTRPAGRFEDLQRRRCSSSEKIAALERDQEMKDWYLNEVYQEIASFHVSPVVYPPEPLQDGTTLFRAPLKPRPPAMLAAVLRSIRQWNRDLQAVLKETGAPVDRVPTGGGRTIDYTLTKWGHDNIRLAPRWRRDEAILRRTKEEAAKAEAHASARPGAHTQGGLKGWGDEMSRLAKAAGIRLNRKRGAKVGVKGIKRNRKPKDDHLEPIKRLLGKYRDRMAAEILQSEGFALRLGDRARVNRWAQETAINAAAAAELGLIARRGLGEAMRGAKIIRARQDRDPLT